MAKDGLHRSEEFAFAQVERAWGAVAEAIGELDPDQRATAVELVQRMAHELPEFVASVEDAEREGE